MRPEPLNSRRRTKRNHYLALALAADLEPWEDFGSEAARYGLRPEMVERRYAKRLTQRQAKDHTEAQVIIALAGNGDPLTWPKPHDLAVQLGLPEGDVRHALNSLAFGCLRPGEEWVEWVRSRDARAPKTSGATEQ